MPTGNEFTDVRFGMTEQSYKNNEREQRSGDYGQAQGPTSSVGTGDYPNTFDRVAGSAPTFPSNYPDQAFGHITATGPSSSYTSERNSIGGDYGQAQGPVGDYYPGTNMVPSPTPSKQFSSDKEGDPKKLVRQATQSINAHADLNQCYGLNQPMATLGSHPWLRDELTVTSEMEPGNATPSAPNMKLPKFGG